MTNVETTPGFFPLREGLEVKAELTDNCNIKFTDESIGKHFFHNLSDEEVEQFAEKISAMFVKQGRWKIVRVEASRG